MHSSPEKGPAATAKAIALGILALVLIAEIRCLAQDIPALIQAIGSWLRISIRIWI